MRLGAWGTSPWESTRGGVNPLAIWFLLQLGHAPEARPVKGVVPFSTQRLAKDWAREELARRGILTATVEVTGYDDAAAQLRITTRMKAQVAEQWHFTDKKAHQELREFIRRNEGQPWQVGR